MIGWPLAGNASIGETVAFIEVNAGKLWRGAMVEAGRAGAVSAAGGAVLSVFCCAWALRGSASGTAKTAGNNRTSRGLEADISRHRAHRQLGVAQIKRRGFQRTNRSSGCPISELGEGKSSPVSPRAPHPATAHCRKLWIRRHRDRRALWPISHRRDADSWRLKRKPHLSHARESVLWQTEPFL